MSYHLRMRTAIVKGPGSRLAGARCRACPHRVQPGQAVVYDILPTYGYVDNRYVIHVDCLRAVVDRAPEGLPARAPKAEFDRIRRRALELAAS